MIFIMLVVFIYKLFRLTGFSESFFMNLAASSFSGKFGGKIWIFVLKNIIHYNCEFNLVLD